ncbi:MAG: hypothetical protein HYY61_05040 [Deltaproteobacteria bacterium]|nr:hypothetical protein [Deltaproteobacteria bacterium]
MKLKCASHSHYPKIGETDEQHKLRRAYHLFDRQKITADQVLEAQKETIRDVIEEQQKAGVDIVTDGQIHWNDPLSYLMKGLEGVEIGGLLRFFDTNFYFRQRKIVGPLYRKSSLLKDEVSFLKKVAKEESKAVLTGPYTLALLSKIETPVYKSVEEAAQVLTEILAEEVEELAEARVSHIQIEEPGYTLVQPNWAWAQASLAALAEQKGKSKLWLTTYFGDVVPFYSKLQELPADVLGLDSTYSSKLLRHIQKEGSDKELALGLLDGRNTKLENPKEGAKALHSLDQVLKNGVCYVTTSCGLEYLPRDKAFKKLQLLEDIKHEYQRGA